MPTPSLSPTLTFLAELEQHNQRDWFEAHRGEYEDARQRFETFVDEVIAGLRAVEDLGPLSARDCTMRIYRDVRFSKDKSPYRNHMAAEIARGGRKGGRMGYYLHVSPRGGSFAATGLYMPSPEQLARFRDQVDRDPAPLKAILAAEPFRRAFGAIEGERLKSAPAGYPKDHPEIDLLRLKQLLVMRPLPDDALTAGEVVALFLLMKPLVDYLNEKVVVG